MPVFNERIALVVEYDGSGFCGWQRQLEHTSVQQELENALSQITGTEVSVIAAGRTDTGVHALMQVVHFDTPVKRPLSAWVRGVNAHLPPNIAVRYAQHIHADFHARFDACERQYRYILCSEPTRPALLTGKVGWTHYELDLPAMQEAIATLEGTHDFSSFRASQCQAKSPIKTMRLAQVSKKGNLFFFDFAANAFLHHMIRNIVGALVYVGARRLSPAEFKQLIQTKNRVGAPPTFMPDGLYLTKVIYPEQTGFQPPTTLPCWFWGEK